MGRRLRRTLFPLLLLLASAGCALPPPSPPDNVLGPPKGAGEQRRYRKVAVLPFPEGTEYPRASGEWFAHALGEGGGLEVVTPGRAELLLRDASFPWPPAEPSPDAWRRAASILGADALVLGGVHRDPAMWIRFVTKVRVVDGGTGQVAGEDGPSGGGGFGFSEYPFWRAAVEEAGRKLRVRLAGEAPGRARAGPPAGTP